MSPVPRADPGRAEGPRGCRPEELPDVIALVDAAMRQGSDQTLLTDYPLVYALGNLPNVQVVADGERVVATAPVLPRRIEGDGLAFGLGVISPTATDPAHQHRGHGSACVAACISRMEASGIELSVLWTLVATFPFYERNGYQAVARYGGSIALTAADADRFARWPGPIARLVDRPDDLGEVVALHRGVVPGIVRSLEQARALYALPRMTTWLALDGARVVGCLVDSAAANKPGLLEAAGEPAVVAGLVRHVLDHQARGAAIEAQVGFAPDGLADVLAAALPDRAPVPSTGNMMVRVNDPADLLRGMRAWLERAVGASGRSVSVDVVDAGMTVSLEWSRGGLAIGSARQSEHVALTRRELASVLFGAHPERPVTAPAALAWLPPLRLPIPILDRS